MKWRVPAPSAARRVGPLLASAAVAGAILASGATSSDAAHVAKASACSAVSAASVSAIIGYTVPNATAVTTNVKATPQNFNASAVSTVCSYGAEKSLASLKKLVLLDSSIESKAITSAELQTSLKKEQQEGHSIGIKVVSYSGLGVTAYYYSAKISGISFQGIAGISGTHVFGASVYSLSVSESKVAALAKLAEKL